MTLRALILGTLVLLPPGCVLAPEGTRRQEARLTRAGMQYDQPFDKRRLPELSDSPTWREVLHRALSANGDLEAAYFQWAAAISRVRQQAAWPAMNIDLGAEYMFSSGKMKSWDRTTVAVRQEGLTLPIKATQAGRVALAEAQAAGERFRAAKFDVQQRVLAQWIDYALLAERTRIMTENASLLRLLADTAANRVRAGAQQQDLLKAQIELQLAENDLANMQAEATQMRAMLNAMLARPADAPLSPPLAMPEPRAATADDAAILAMGVSNNPELSALAEEVRGRANALELARMRYIPDFQLSAGFTGSVSQFIGGMLSLPTAIPMIRGAIKEARAELGRMEAMRRQTTLDRAARFVAVLYAMRNSERQAKLLRERILPAARLVMDNSLQAYSTGAIGFVELIDSQRTLLEVRLLVAEALAARERSLIELEALAGTDIETLDASATQSTD